MMVCLMIHGILESMNHGSNVCHRHRRDNVDQLSIFVQYLEETLPSSLKYLQ